MTWRQFGKVRGMANKPGVMIYFETARAVKGLDFETKGRLFDAIMEYAENGEVPAFDGVLAAVWPFVANGIDRDASRYADIITRRQRAAYAKWWKEYARKAGIDPNDEEAKERWIDMQMQAKDANASDAMQMMPTTTPTQTTTPTATTAGASTAGIQPQSTHVAYGLYKNVFLTVEEHAALERDVPDLYRIVDKLSLHMQSTGRQYASHEATVRKWAMEDAEKQATARPDGDWCTQTNRTPYSAAYQNIDPALLED